MSGIPTIGSRASVMHGNAQRTSGGLTKAHLKKNKRGEIVSRKKSDQMKKKYNRMKSKGGKVWKAFRENQIAMKRNPEKFASRRHRRH